MSQLTLTGCGPGLQFEPDNLSNLLFWWQPDQDVKSNGALHYPSGSYSQIPNSRENKMVPGQSMTFQILFKPDESGGAGPQAVFSKRISLPDNGPDYCLYVNGGGGVLTFAAGNGGDGNTVNSGVTISPGSWYFVVCGFSFADSSIFISVNNEAVQSSFLADVNGDGNDLLIGASNGGSPGNFLPMAWQSFGIWNGRAINDAPTINTLYNGGIGLFYGDLTDDILVSVAGWYNGSEYNIDIPDLTSAGNDSVTVGSTETRVGVVLGTASSGSKVYRWYDQTSNNWNATTDNEQAKEPTYYSGSIYGYGVVDFAGGGTRQFLQASFGGHTIQPHTVFIVMRITENVADQVIFNGGTESPQPQLKLYQNILAGSGDKYSLDSGNTPSDAITLAEGTWYTCCLTFGSAGNAIINGATTMIHNTGSNQLTGFTMGGDQNRTNLSKVQFVETFCYSEALSSVNIDLCLAYLLNKYHTY